MRDSRNEVINVVNGGGQPWGALEKVFLVLDFLETFGVT